MIYEWRRGKQVGERQGNPVEHARSVGIELAPPDVPAPVSDGAVVTVAVIDGLAAAEVRRLLGSTADEGWLQVSEAEGSTILSAVDGDLGSAPWDLTDAPPERDVYFISGDRARREINIQVLRGGETTGTFDVPSVQSDMTLSAIRGATTVSGILDALSVGPALFPRNGWSE